MFEFRLTLHEVTCLMIALQNFGTKESADLYEVIRTQRNEELNNFGNGQKD